MSCSSPLPQRLPGPKKGEKSEQTSEKMKTSQGKSDVKVSNNMLALSDIDEASIDEVIFNLIELRNLRRPHLPPLSQPLRGNLTVIPPPDPSVPPKRG